MLKEALENNRFIANSTMLASAAMVVAGVIQITDEQSSESTAVGIEHVSLAAFSVMLIALVPLVLHLGRRAGRESLAKAASVAMVALSAISVTSNINGEDLAIFPAIAVPANLVILVTLVLIGVGLRRRAGVALPIAIALPLTWILLLPLSAVGGGFLAAAVYAVIAYKVSNGTLEGEAGAAIPATA